MITPFTHRFEPASDPAAPVLLVLHGTGGDENDLLPIARMLHPGAAILSPRGRVLERGMPRFFRRLAEGVFDQEDLRIRTIELAAFVTDATAHYGLDASRVVAVGYSNGANIAASVFLAHPTVLAGAVLLRAMVPFEPARLPDLAGKPILIAAGRRDPLIPQALTQRLAAILEQAGADLTVRWYDVGHELSPREIYEAAAWIAEHPFGVG
ncbi:MAG: alpha/beta hydrolase [Acidobacteria bacterium]|nr:alpha/beta hydrolase [Acidobacteriota bacterium]MCA1652417.1 alpha/beta hydrolase [Acidobacteriota bacterium]